MFLLINIIGLIVFLWYCGIIFKRSQNIQWQSIGILVVLNPFLAWFFIYFDWGQKAVRGAANGIAWVVQSAHADNMVFAFGASLDNCHKWMDMAVAALSLILFNSAMS